MRPKSGVVHLCGLSLAVALCATLRSGGEAAPKPPLATAKPATEQRTPDGKVALASALERLRRTGSFNHPDYPWVVRARRVHGDTLYFVEFLCRREDGKGFDRVGKAVQATLAFSAEYEPFRFPFEEAMPAVRRDTLRVRVCQMDMQTEDVDVFVDDRIFDLPLPARLRESGFRPYAEAEGRLSEEQRKALDKSYPLRREQKLLLAAFGDECADLLRGEIGMGETGQTVVAWDKAVPRDSSGRCKFARFAVARFDKTGEVVLRFQGKDVSAKTRPVIELLSGDESQTIRLRGSGGLKFVLPGIKAAR